VVTDIRPTDQQIQRLVDVAESLEAHLEDSAIAGVFGANEAEFTATAAEEAELTSRFIYLDPTAPYVGDSRDVTEMEDLAHMGLQFAIVDSPNTGEFRAELSPEQALSPASRSSRRQAGRTGHRAASRNSGAIRPASASGWWRKR
jgi:hypothetical protein